MGGVLTLAATVAAAAGAVAAYRFIERRQREVTDFVRSAKARARGEQPETVIDYERDPATGVFKPRG
ncbi:MAG: hypothetical protein AAGD92_09895 [Pseudomonadota bacterium]